MGYFVGNKVLIHGDIGGRELYKYEHKVSYLSLCRLIGLEWIGLRKKRGGVLTLCIHTYG